MNKTANPGPLGLLGFGMTTILLNLHNAGIIPLSLVIISMGIALGGFAQIVAGIISFRQGNTFAGTAFTAYGFFWLSLVFIWLLPNDYPALIADKTSMGFYLLIWGIFTLFMTIGTYTHNTSTKLIFTSLTLLFFFLAVADFTDSHFMTVIAGYEGIICGGLALYGAVAQIVNNELGKKL